VHLGLFRFLFTNPGTTSNSRPHAKCQITPPHPDPKLLQSRCNLNEPKNQNPKIHLRFPVQTPHQLHNFNERLIIVQRYNRYYIDQIYAIFLQNNIPVTQWYQYLQRMLYNIQIKYDFCHVFDVFYHFERRF